MSSAKLDQRIGMSDAQVRVVGTFLAEVHSLGKLAQAGQASLQALSGSQWRPVCFVVQADDKADAAGIKQWLQAKHSLRCIDLSEQGLLASVGPIGEYLAAAKEVSLGVLISCKRSSLGKLCI